MYSIRRLPLLAALFLMFSAPGLASPITCDGEGVQPQRVHLSYGGEFLDYWEVTGEDPHEIELPTGFRLGVAVSPASREVYLESARLAGEFMLEAVTIELFDMSTTPPERLARNHGGSNSVQGFGPRGGATTVEEVGPEDVELFLQRPVCIRVADVPSGTVGSAP